jgi:hypothetical protein
VHSHGAPSPHLAPGFSPQPDWNLKNFGGPTTAELTFVNRYLGGAAAWSSADIHHIDTALSAAMSDTRLNTVIAQYFPHATVAATMLASATVDGTLHHTVYKDTAEKVAAQLYAGGALGTADPARSVINMMLPKGIVLSDDFSPGFHPTAEEDEERHARRKRGVLRVGDDDAASSKNGLGGYHGSIHVGHGTEIYYAIGVYSEGANGIDAFGVPWKNVVATFYHELNEARTDLQVEDVNATGNDHLLGWYSPNGQGEIGDLPINACGGDLSLVFKEVTLASGGGTVPIQLMWSNDDAGPAASTGQNVH